MMIVDADNLTNHLTALTDMKNKKVRFEIGWQKVNILTTCYLLELVKLLIFSRLFFRMITSR